MVKREVIINRNILLVLLSAAVFLCPAALLIVGPLLVALAEEYKTSLAMAGQLAAAPAITWAMTAPVLGPVSDIYGKRGPLLLGLLVMTIGVLGAVLTRNFASMLALRLLTGIGAATVTPTCVAIIGDTFPPETRGRAIGWLFSSSGAAAALAMPLFALLLGIGGWRLPFFVMGLMILGVLLLCLLWLPRSRRQTGASPSFFSHYREVGSNSTAWFVLAANALQRVVFFGVFAYLAAYFIQIYQMQAADTALLLGMAGSGGIIGGFVGGRIADHRRRAAFFALSCVCAGLFSLWAFTAVGMPWMTAVPACGAALFSSISLPVTAALLMEMAGNSRTTAAGLFVVSNQAGAFAGPALGGLILSLGGFSGMGFFYLGASFVAAIIVCCKVSSARRSPVKTFTGLS